MKKLILILSILCFLTAGTFPGFAANQSRSKTTKIVEQETKKQKSQKEKAPFACGYEQAIRVGGFVTNAPFGWVNIVPSAVGSEQDVYLNDGFAYRLFEKMTTDLGLKIKNVGFPSYHAALNALKKGNIDVLAGSYYDSRTLGTATSILYPSYFTNPFVVFFKKGNEREVTSIDDLKDLKGGVRQEELIYSLIWRQLPRGMDLQQINGARKAFEMLINGEIDFLISSAYAGEAEIRRFKLMDDITMSQTILVAPDLFYLFASNSNCAKLMPLYEEQLKKEKADENALMQSLISYIDTWGLNFKENPSMLEELQEDPEETTP